MEKLKKLTLEQIAYVMGGKFLKEPKNKEILTDLLVCIRAGLFLEIWEENIKKSKDDHYGYSYTIQDLHNFLDKLNYIINP
jgi:hypothetical protein